jgi:hypothetical protein
MTSARQLLEKGQADLQRQFGEVFTIEDLPGVLFTGRCEEVTYSNTLGAGGFLPEARSVLYVRPDQFTPYNLAPWIGMRVMVKGRQFIVNEVGKSFHRWQLMLEQAFPKATEIPCRVSVLAAEDWSPLLYSAGLLEPD